MAQDHPFAEDLDRVRRALADLFSPAAIGWQLGGTMAAALCFAVACWGAEQILPRSGAIAFILTGAGFILAYIILCVTGCIVAHSLTSPEVIEDPAASAHFLIDHAGTAFLLPFAASAAAVAITAVASGLAALWTYPVWQSVLVIPAAAAFVILFLIVITLFVLLLIIPAMVVVEQSSFSDVFWNLRHLLWTRKAAIVRIFGVGLAVAAVVAVPVLLAVHATIGLAAWIYNLAAGAPIGDFPSFVLTMLKAVLVWAPVLAVPLVFLNALSLHSYDELGGPIEETEESSDETQEPGTETPEEASTD